MSWMLSIWVVGALLALCGGQNTEHEAVNRSGEFIAEPGSCPTADGLHPSSVDWELDLDCPGWQKCCQRLGCAFFCDPASSAKYFKNGGSCWNATVTVKTDYQHLVSKDDGLVNLRGTLQAMVTGALEAEVSISNLCSWPVHPNRTATSLLICCNFTLSLYDVTSKLHRLEQMPEVSSVSVQDVDECRHPALHQCSLHSDCSNTVGSYQCMCHQGYIDVDPNNPGVYCTGEAQVTEWNNTGTHLPLVNTTFSPTFNNTRDPPGNGTVGPPISSETSVAAPLQNTSSVTSNPSHASPETNSAPSASMSSAAESTLPATTCLPARISSLWADNVTGTSITIYWSGQFHTNQTFRVILSKASEVIFSLETSRSTAEVRRLQPGALYNVTVTPCTCGGGGGVLHTMIKTDSRTLEATTRLTNIQFTGDLRNPSSRSSRSLSGSFLKEVYQSLSPEIEAMVDSGQMRLEIKNFSPGSVVVNFAIIFNPVQSHEISNVSKGLVDSLINSSKYVVDISNTSITDFDECASGENDCSVWASCRNTWASYTCFCFDGFIDKTPKRPGRTCQATTPSSLSSASDAPTPGAVSVQCRSAAITVTVARELLLNADIQESALYVGMMECGVNGGNDTHVQLTVAWDECATLLVHNETSYTALSTLSNTMDPYNSPNGSVEAPRTQLKVPIMCTYMRNISAEPDTIKDVTGGLGSFQVKVQLMNGTSPLPHNSSLSPAAAVVVEVSLNSSSEQITVVINKCWATPTPDPGDTPSYSFLENSCPLNVFTQVLMNGNSSTSRVSVQIFSFVSVNVIYLHCQVQVCVKVGSDTCEPDCFLRKARTGTTIGTAFGLSGPVLRSAEESLEDKFDILHIVGISCLGVGLSLFFIIGFVCLLYYQRNRIGHYNFNAKPKPENFTNLDCNT